MTSTNGSTWTAVAPKESINRVGIAYASGEGYGRWLACGAGIQTSKNGIDWSNTLINSGAYSLRCAEFNGNGLWVIAGANGKLLTIQEVNEAEKFYLMDYADKFDYIYIKGAK